VEEGWCVEALAESADKSPDFEIKKGLVRYEVECKRFARRGDYTEEERDAWLRQWSPVATWLVKNKLSFFFTIIVHAELTTLREGYLFETLLKQYDRTRDGFRPLDSAVLTMNCVPTDYDAIAKGLRASNVKCQSIAERYLLTGRHERDFGLTCAIGGERVSIGPRTTAGNVYWDSIDYASGAYWRSDSPSAIDAKARDVVKRLSEATTQFTGRLGGIVHLGIEAAEGDDVELVRTNKILATIRRFDPRGKPLEWVFVHYFTGESLPDSSWNLDETCQWHGVAPEYYRPLRANYVVAPAHARSIGAFRGENHS
jgi:hypothetical protein